MRHRCLAGLAEFRLQGFAAGAAAARVFPQFSTKKAFGGAPAMGGKGNEVQDYSGDVKVSTCPPPPVVRTAAPK